MRGPCMQCLGFWIEIGKDDDRPRSTDTMIDPSRDWVYGSRKSTAWQQRLLEAYLSVCRYACKHQEEDKEELLDAISGIQTSDDVA